MRPLTDRLGARPLRKLSAADVRSALAGLSEQLSTRSLQIAHNCEDAGRVEKRRGVHASAPVFAGTRIRVSTVQRYLRQGYQTEEILEAFPDLSVADVEEARRQQVAAS